MIESEYIKKTDSSAADAAVVSVASACSVGE